MAGVAGEFTVKSADTDVSALIVNVQVVAVPEHAPPHELKVESEAGVSVKVTIVPASTEAGQVAPPQVIVPEPVLETDGEIVMLYEVEEDATAPSVVPPPVLSAGGVCPVEVFDTAPSVVPPPVEPSGGGVPVEVFDTAAFVNITAGIVGRRSLSGRSIRYCGVCSAAAGIVGRRRRYG